MPSLKMKTKSTMGCLRENNGLHVCQKSSKISKTSFSHVKNLQQEAQLQTSISHKQDDSFCTEVIVQEIRSNKANRCELLDEENLQDHTQANCSSAIETIFSPILESIDNDKCLNANDHRGDENDNLDLPSLEDNDSDSSSRNSGEYQSCNVSDFFISDMIVSSPFIERSSTFATIIEPTCLLDYECDESSRIFDDEVMPLTFPEDSDDKRNYSEESNLYMTIHQLRSCNQEPDVNTYPDWDPADYLDPQIFIRNLPEEPRETKSITLVLDIDETLVHSSLESCNDADFTFPVFVNMKEHTVYVKQRPYLRAFLERVSDMFRIVVFTASQSIYAKQLLDILDPDGNIISRRAYRESCIFEDGSYTKDLTVLGVDLAKVAIIDNSPQVFRLQVNNGIPIKSWFNDPSDRALMSLLPFLETLVDAEDVRPIIANKFGNKK